MLNPLSPGSHTIHFGGTQVAGDFPPLTLDVTYDLTVQPGGRGRGHLTSDPNDPTPSSWSGVKQLFK
jgi:hypothetical protein